ncbi:unnamed protein product, partial [marine sediment metagenome]
MPRKIIPLEIFFKIILGHFELLIGFFGSWAVSIIILVIYKWKQGDRLPKGSILVGKNNNIKVAGPPGSR